MSAGRTFLPLLLLLAADTGAWAATEPAVRFLHPPNLATVVGQIELRLAADVPQGQAVARLDVFVDGRLHVTLARPPWTARWDAGLGERSHELSAVLHLADGREARTAIRTTELRVDVVERVDLVNLYLVVRNAAGDYVGGLEARDFTVFEEGRQQKIERFSASHKPLRVALVLDTSLSMARQDRLAQARAAALQFLDLLEPGDQCQVVTFSDSVHVAQEFTDDKSLLAEAIRRTEARGGTALYDAVWDAARGLDDFDGRRVLLLLSDGRDEAANGLEPGSLHTIEEALDQTLRSEVMVFTIGLGSNLDREYVLRWTAYDGQSNVDTSMSLASVLGRLAEATGGRALLTARPGKLARAFDEVAADLRNQYTIAYTSDDPTRDGKWRRIQIRANRDDLEVVSRKGYYALARRSSK